jgi:hypothetical protein
MPAKNWGDLTEKERRVEIARHTPRSLLFERMYGAVIRELIPESEIHTRRVEEIFEGMDPNIVLLAIADLAAMLIVDTACVEDNEADWEELFWTVAHEMHSQVVEEGGGEPKLPSLARAQ